MMMKKLSQAQHKLALGRVRRGLGLDASNRKHFKVGLIPGGFVVSAKTAAAVSRLTAAHRITMPVSS